MTPPWRARGRPPWWPDNEPWPPQGFAWRARRRRFVRRAGVILAVPLFLSVIGATSLVSLLLNGSALASTAVPATAVTMVLLLGSVVFVLLFSGGMRRIGMPLGDVVSAADRVGAGDLSVRVREVGPPFLRSLARAFNTMIARLKAQDELRRQLMADVAHELRTPLSVMQGRLEGILDDVYGRDDAQIKELLEETRVLSRLVEDLRTLANAEAGALVLQREPTDVTVLAGETLKSFRAQADARHITLDVMPAPSLPLIEVDPVRLREVLTNLVANAMQHTPEGGAVSISIAERNGEIVIDVSDTGTGIAAEDLPHVFDRFFKGRTSRGSGLGLAIARKLIAAHGGTISASSAPGRGTTVTFSLPMARDRRPHQ